MPLRIRRGTEAQRTSFIPVAGEPIFATDTKELYVGDGVTPGGILASGVHGVNNLTAAGLFFELSIGSNELEFHALSATRIGLKPGGVGPSLSYNFAEARWEIDSTPISVEGHTHSLAAISAAGANEGDIPQVVGGVLTFAAPPAGGESGITNLADADDVDLTGRADGHVIKWNQASGKYVHGPDLNDGSGTPSLEGLSDTSGIGAATTDQVLGRSPGGVWTPRNQEPGPTMLRNLDAVNFEIQRPVIRGNQDTSYNLAADSGGLISGGVAQLSAQYNRYHHTNVTSELEIRLPGQSGTRYPYGSISVKLGTGGRIILGNQPHQYRWMRQRLTDPEPSIPTAEGDSFQISYYYDPVIGGYMVNVTQAVPLPAPGTAVILVPGSVRRSSFPEVNNSNPSWTVPWRSTVQDGTVYKIVGWITDNSAGKTPIPPANLTPIVATPAGQAGPYQFWGYYKPSQAELNSGNPFAVSAELSNEFGQFVSFEVRYADPSNPVAFTIVDSLATSRSEVGPLAIANPQDGSLLISSFSRNDATPMGHQALNTGLWQEMTDLTYNYPSVFGVVPILVHRLVEAEAVEVMTPLYQSAAATEIGMVAFALRT